MTRRLNPKKDGVQLILSDFKAMHIGSGSLKAAPEP